MKRIPTELENAGETLLRIAEQRKLDQAEAFLVSNNLLTIRLAGNAIFESKNTRDIGVGLRVVKGKRLGFSSTADISRASLNKLTDAATSTSNARKLSFKYSFPTPQIACKVRGVFDEKLAEIPAEKAGDFAYEMVEAALTKNKKVKDSSGALNLVEYHAQTLNTNGVSARNDGTFFEASLSVTAENGQRTAEGSDAAAGRRLNDLKPKAIGTKAAEMASVTLEAERVKESIYDVVLDYEPVQELLGSLAMLISPLMAKSFYPLLLDKVGKKIGSSSVTFIDDPSMTGGVNSQPVDDEGTVSKPLRIISGGVFRSFVYDSFYGRLDRKKSTGNAVRSSFVTGVSTFPGKNYNAEPIPAAVNPYFKPGNWKREQILEDTRYGVLVQRFHYTRVNNPTRGDFTSILRMGLFMIKNGEVVGALKKSRLLDNILTILLNVDAVSDKLVVAGNWGNYNHVPVMRTKARVTPVD